MADMDELPADAAVAADAGSSPVMRCPTGADAAELLDIDMDELAGMLALIAAHRFGRLQGR